MFDVKLDESMLNEVKSADIKEYLKPSGLRYIRISEAYGDKSLGGANFIRINFDAKATDEEIKDNAELANNGIKGSFNLYISSGDDKGNKTTFTDKSGRERPLPAWGQLKSILEACGVNKDLNTFIASGIDGVIEIGSEKKKVKIFQDLIGKECYLGLVQKNDDYGNLELKCACSIDTQKDELDKKAKALDKAQEKENKKEPASTKTEAKKEEVEKQTSGW